MVISFPHVPSCLSLSLSFNVFFAHQHFWLLTFPSFTLLYFLFFQESTDPAKVINPCYPKSFNITIKASSVYDTECTKKPANYDPNKEYYMVGTGNSDKCESLVKSIFDFKTCTSSHCSFNGVEQPPVTGDFMVKRSANKTHERGRDENMKIPPLLSARRTQDSSSLLAPCCSTALPILMHSRNLLKNSATQIGKWWVLFIVIQMWYYQEGSEGKQMWRLKWEEK